MARPFAEVVRAKNVSLSGAALLGVHAKIRAGRLLDVQHGSQPAQFWIAWAGSGETGIEALLSSLALKPCIEDLALSETFEMVGAG